jgi:hypothetical protein
MNPPLLARRGIKIFSNYKLRISIVLPPLPLLSNARKRIIPFVAIGCEYTTLEAVGSLPSVVNLMVIPGSWMLA